MRFVLTALLVAALVTAQVLIGGARLLYSIPAVIILALLGILASVRPSSFKRASLPYCIGATAMFCVYLITRLYLSPVDYLARQDTVIVAGSLIIYLVTALFLDRPACRLQVFAALLGLAVIQVGLGAIQFKAGGQYMLLPWISRADDSWRASGFYISANHFAGLMEVVALMALSIVIWSDLKSSRKVLIGYLGACCLLGLAISGSRGGYLSFGFGVAILARMSLAAYRSGKVRSVGSTLLLAAGIFVLAGFVAWLLIEQSGVLKARVAATYDPENMRWELWSAAIKQFRLAPLWGTGSGTYLYYGRLYRSELVQSDPIHVHNDYLHLLAEYGGVGVACFALFLCTHLVAGLRNIAALTSDQNSRWEAHANQSALQIGAVSVIAAYSIHSIVDFNLHIPANAFLLAWMFGIVANPGIAGGTEIAGSKFLSLCARIILFLASTGMMCFGIPKLPGEWYAEKARMALRDFRLPEARTLAHRGLHYEQGNPNIYYYAGETARQMALLDPKAADELSAEAVSMFKGALALFPQDVRCMLKLAQTYDALGQFDAAEAQLERAAEWDPNNSYVDAAYGLHYQSQGKLDEAREHYELAIRLDNRNKLALTGLAEIDKVLSLSHPATAPSPNGENDLSRTLRDLGVKDPEPSRVEPSVKRSPGNDSL